MALSSSMLRTRVTSQGRPERSHSRIVASLAHPRSSGQAVLQVCAAAAHPLETISTDENISTREGQATPAGLITRESVQDLEAILDNGAGVAALRRFNENLRALTPENWEARLRPVFAELCYNLESFNPAFTAVLLKTQSTLGVSDYRRRDVALKHLIQPLAGEYGMHNGQEQAATHRELFSSFFESLFHQDMYTLLEDCAAPAAAQAMFARMMADIMGGGGQFQGPESEAHYAMGYNLAIEYLADYEKTWMLDSFRALSNDFLKAQGRDIDWVFLEVHAEGEAEHAAIGHAAVVNFVPADAAGVLEQAMLDHDRDFAIFYNHLADLLA